MRERSPGEQPPTASAGNAFGSDQDCPRAQPGDDRLSTASQVLGRRLGSLKVRAEWSSPVLFIAVVALEIGIGVIVVGMVSEGAGHAAMLVGLVLGVVAFMAGIAALVWTRFVGRRVDVFEAGMSLPQGRQEYLVPWVSARISAIGRYDQSGRLAADPVTSWTIATAERNPWRSGITITEQIDQLFRKAMGEASAVQRSPLLSQLRAGQVVALGDLELSSFGFDGPGGAGDWVDIQTVRVVGRRLIAVTTEGESAVITERVDEVPNLSLVVDLMMAMIDDHHPRSSTSFDR